MSGHDVDLTSPDLHPRVRSLLQRRHELQNAIEDLKHNIAFRPQPSQVRIERISVKLNRMLPKL